MNIKTLQLFYNGFEMHWPIGNNAFSYEQRHNKSIWVPALISGDVKRISPGESVVFSEIENGHERNCIGLKNFVYFRWQGKPVFVFDNHNHAFFFWMAAFQQGIITSGLHLLHVDQHSDMREPAVYPQFSLGSDLILQEVFDYTNQILNVGNFIRPALELGLFTEVNIIDSSTAFEKKYSAPFILDIDLDIFAPEMDYIPQDRKLLKIRELMVNANFITIATSPYFISQDFAIKKLSRLFM